MKMNFKKIYERTKLMLLKPNSIWPWILKENLTVKDIFRNYLLPVSLAVSLLVLLLSLFKYNILHSVGLAFINLISALCGAWFAYLITREYLCVKLNCANNVALNLTIYSSAVFILFHGIGTALGSIFIGQLFTLLSFIFIRTLYSGIERLPEIPANQKTNILIITSLAIICIPIIISQLLMILFNISAINI